MPRCGTRWAADTTTSRSTWLSGRSAARWPRPRGRSETMAMLIGKPISRIDGPLKVSGRATYSAEYWNVGQPLYGFIVGATIGRGHVAAIDTNEAEQAPGVRMVMTHRNAPAQGTPDLSS